MGISPSERCAFGRCGRGVEIGYSKAPAGCVRNAALWGRWGPDETVVGQERKPGRDVRSLRPHREYILYNLRRTTGQEDGAEGGPAGNRRGCLPCRSHPRGMGGIKTVGDRGDTRSPAGKVQAPNRRRPGHGRMRERNVRLRACSKYAWME